ncbi:MAG: NADP-dependent oxidoreductase [Pseudorhodoplanes sp.]
MRAIEFKAYGGPEVLQLQDASAPVPGDGEVLIDVHAVSVNPVDWKIRSGRMAGGAALASAMITGRDGAGVVTAAGPGTDPASVGRRVAFLAPRGRGTWADQVTMPDANIALIPDGVSFPDAAAVPLAGTSAWIPLVDIAKAGPGMRVLIHAGAGGVGSLGIQIARARGAHVIATCSERNVDFVRSLGANEVIAYDRTPFEDAARNVDVVFDTMGGDVHDRSYKVLRRGGLMVCLMAEPFTDRGAEHGVTVTQAQVLPRQDILDALLKMMADGSLRVPVEAILPFADFRRAQELSQGGRVRGKIVLRLRDPDGSIAA